VSNGRNAAQRVGTRTMLVDSSGSESGADEEGPLEVLGLLGLDGSKRIKLHLLTAAKKPGVVKTYWSSLTEEQRDVWVASIRRCTHPALQEEGPATVPMPPALLPAARVQRPRASL
jgi:hypothetical protein